MSLGLGWDVRPDDESVGDKLRRYSSSRVWWSLGERLENLRSDLLVGLKSCSTRHLPPTPY